MSADMVSIKERLKRYSFIKLVLPIFRYIKKSKIDYLDIPRLHAAWKSLAEGATLVRASSVVGRLVVIPPDPWSLVGSKGDEAMIMAVVSRVKKQSPGLIVGIVTANGDAEEVALKLGFESLPLWTDECSLFDADSMIKQFNPDAVLVFGADVMDGYYGPVTPTRMLALADLAARRGVRAALVGFSFNRQPHAAMRKMFSGISDALIVNVRDPISYDRYLKFVGGGANLVADSAFMLSPEYSLKANNVKAWVEQRRNVGDRVIAFNIHPLLIKDITLEKRLALIATSVRALKSVLHQCRVSILLLSHDYRGSSSDDVCLDPIYAELFKNYGSRLMYVQDQMNAAELKAVAGEMDGVVTGRMHLAIAALGMGVPVAALTYQDKFQGLMNHFDLPPTFMLPAELALDADRMEELILGFIENIDQLKAQVCNKLLEVKSMSEMNLNGIL